jgi:hypothetical protein
MIILAGVSPIFCIAFGAILGVVFIKVQDRLPGRTVIRRSVVFAFALYSISLLGNIYIFFADKSAFLSFWGSMEVSNSVFLIVDLLLGVLFGYLITNR